MRAVPSRRAMRTTAFENIRRMQESSDGRGNFTHTSNPDLIRILLAHGADVHQASSSGNTALHACAHNCTRTSDAAISDVGVAAAKILLKHGASPYAKNAKGKTVFDFGSGYPALETLFRKYLAIDIRRFVLGTAEEYPRRARLRDLVPLIATYIV